MPHLQQNTLQNEQVLDKEITDLAILKRHLVACLGILSKQLRERKCLCTKLRIKIRYADFNTFSKEKKIPPTCNDRTLEREAFGLVTKTLDHIRSRFGDAALGTKEI